MGKKHDSGCKGGEDCVHEGHLCRMTGRLEFDRIRELVKDARYLCRKCGRAARLAENVCKPVEL
ncbi:MAG: hypothetical protein JSU90_10890 [Nitrospiraceae bacterium]|nr:MAG: hypothetical protein JSU90_10890 [Nitrospiraceae bacterium]